MDTASLAVKVDRKWVPTAVSIDGEALKAVATADGETVLTINLADIAKVACVKCKSREFACQLEVAAGGKHLLAAASDDVLRAWLDRLSRALSEQGNGELREARLRGASKSLPRLLGSGPAVDMAHVNVAAKSRIFDLYIEQALWRDGCGPSDVAPLVVQCVTFIEKHGLKLEGIYRVPGGQKVIASMKEAIDRGERVVFGDDEDPNVVAGLLKLYLRGLSEPAIPFGMYELFTAVAGYPDDGHRPLFFKLLVERLPPPNRALLRFIVRHLCAVVASSGVNKMELHNVALIFGTLLLRLRDETALEMMRNTGVASRCVSVLVGNEADIFNARGSSLSFVSVVRANFDFEPLGAAELALKKGDIVFVSDADGDEWLVGWRGGAHGSFPKAFVEELLTLDPHAAHHDSPLPAADESDGEGELSMVVPEGAAGAGTEAAAAAVDDAEMDALLGSLDGAEPPPPTPTTKTRPPPVPRTAPAPAPAVTVESLAAELELERSARQALEMAIELMATQMNEMLARIEALERP